MDSKTPLNFFDVKKQPDTHAWSGSAADYDGTPVISGESLIPVIDLTDLRAAELIRTACEEWGVFQITNHGISMDLLDQAEKESMKLFNLPADQKALAARNGQQTGYGRMDKPMWLEGFIICGSPMEHAIKLWPDNDEVDRIKFCNVFLEYQKEMKGLTEKLIAILVSLLGLNLEEDLKWLKPKLEGTQSKPVLHLNYYPPCPDPTQVVGLPAHTNSSLFTLLYPNTATNYSGLQFLSEDNSSWVSVEPIRNAIVVNLGDLMQVLTNGRFKSVIHRAVINKEMSRSSRAYFYGPPEGVKISPAAEMVDDEHPLLYKTVSWEEVRRAKAGYFTKALYSFKIYSSCMHQVN